MDKLDEQLREALRRVDAPPDFVERVVARGGASAVYTPRRSWWQMPMLRWATAAAVILSVGVGTLEYKRQQRERAAGEAARRQAIVALHIAGEKFKLARDRVQQLSGTQTEER